MNKLIIIGNLVKDPEIRTTTSGISVCKFTVAVNRKHRAEGQPEADYFRVSAWRELGDNCGKYLQKGKKVCVVGSVSLMKWEATDNIKAGASLEVTAAEVEFLSPKDEGSGAGNRPEEDERIPGGFTAVETDELPF